MCFSTPFWTFKVKVCGSFIKPTSPKPSLKPTTTLSTDIHRLVYTTALSFEVHLDIFAILVFWNKIIL